MRTFNPGLWREGEGWIFAYRIVATDGLRRIGICRLNRELEIVPGSQVRLIERKPSVVLSCGHTSLAVEDEIGREIYVRPTV